MAAFLLAVAFLMVAALVFGTWGRTPTDRPHWDEGKAQSFIGKTVIIGLTYEDAAGAVQRREQMHGRIIGADIGSGFAVALAGERRGETYWLPPDPDKLSAAQPGEYRLRSTGEVVVDPDLLSNWIVNAPTN